MSVTIFTTGAPSYIKGDDGADVTRIDFGDDDAPEEYRRVELKPGGRLETNGVVAESFGRGGRTLEVIGLASLRRRGFGVDEEVLAQEAAGFCWLTVDFETSVASCTQGDLRGRLCPEVPMGGLPLLQLPLSAQVRVHGRLIVMGSDAHGTPWWRFSPGTGLLRSPSAAARRPRGLGPAAPLLAPPIAGGLELGELRGVECRQPERERGSGQRVRQVQHVHEPGQRPPRRVDRETGVALRLASLLGLEQLRRQLDAGSSRLEQLVRVAVRIVFEEPAHRLAEGAPPAAASLPTLAPDLDRIQASAVKGAEAVRANGGTPALDAELRRRSAARANALALARLSHKLHLSRAPREPGTEEMCALTTPASRRWSPGIGPVWAAVRRSCPLTSLAEAANPLSEPV